ncbi:molybdenum ABC transporter substrate-binding protein [Paenibacillus beijingensis]|uniref:Molybdenum ABC transporter substrate-binding protein n=1 Tax=Paenibacillus beijingensis TaxID=1126833 RepID=A0A0D5NRQ8_9BACL|nr:molybdenum ABC transporter substrate-binding protein [Paenibacillus beijingensis]
MVKTGWISLLVLLVVMAASGCGAGGSASKDNGSAAPDRTQSGTGEGAADAGAAAELTVSAAASLTDALNEIKAAYEASHPDVKLVFNFGASGTLQKQISQGAPADLFLSASSKNMKSLVDEGLVDAAEQTNLLAGELVVVVPAEGSGITKLEDLQNPAVSKVAVGIPESVPAGSYARDALTAANLWDKLQLKTVQAKDVRQVLSYVETGNADAGFVYRTDALATDKAKIAFAVAPSLYKPIVYPAGIVKATKNRDAAAAFYQYLQSEESLDVFRKYGFSVPTQ